MKILYFGTYDKKEGYPRNRILLNGLKRMGMEVKECHSELWQGNKEKIKSLRRFPLSLGLRMVLAYAGLVWKFLWCGPYDLIIVGYPGYLDIHLAKLLNRFRNKPIVLDAFLSLYQTAVEDRCLVSPQSSRGKILAALERWACQTASRVLLDTQAHIQYLSKRLGLPSERFLAIPVGAQDEIFFHRGRTKDHARSREEESVEKSTLFREIMATPFPVIFFGTFLPLHGVEVIVRAAHALRKEKDFRFFLIGDGPEWSAAFRLSKEIGADNVYFHRKWISSAGIANILQKSFATLGLFGSREKSRMVVPCKVYSSLAAGCPVITADTPAAQEFLKNEETALLIPPGDPVSLAEALYGLGHNKKMRDRIGKEGRKHFEFNFFPEHLAYKLLAGLYGEDAIQHLKEESFQGEIPTTKPHEGQREREKILVGEGGEGLP